MELIICIIVGIIIGIVFGRRVFRSDVVGSLRVDQSDPDSGPYLFLELSHEVHPSFSPFIKMSIYTPI